MKQRHQTKLPLIALAILVLPLSAGAARSQTGPAGGGDPAEAYGYFRTVEGSSLLASREPEETRDLEINLPILAGDAVQVGGGARVEAVLADGSVARLEAGSELVFDQLFRSPDSPEAASTRLVLLAGEMQMRVPDETADTAPVEIESAAGRVYLIRGGTYWIGVDGADGTRLIVREGSAEVLTEQGSHLVHAGEEIEISARYGVETRVARAGYQREIERWADELERTAYVADHGPVERDLRYSAAPLARSGSWVRVDGRVAWRPRVRYGWRPFTDGRWVYTPSGLSWVSTASWGHVTSHYGSWDYLPAYGWCWFPGSVYSPAWVYWYWGPTHAAWVPYGYYARHYGPSYGRRWGGGGYGLRFGVYGWASGGWSVFADWTFCPLGSFGRRGGRYYYRSGNDLAYSRRALAVPRGIITTDTRGIDRAVWTRPYEVRRRLGEVHRGAFAKDPRRGGGDLPDVTSFVSRRRELPENLRAVVKPLGDSHADRRPALNRIDRSVKPADRVARRSTEGMVHGETRGFSPTRKPVDATRSLSGGDRTVARNQTFDRSGGTEVRAGTRFQTKPVRRPTEFERAPTTVYGSPGNDRARVQTRVPTQPIARATDGKPTLDRGDERPAATLRRPTSIYTKPAAPSRQGSGAVSGGRSTTGSAGARPLSERPVLERRPVTDERSRATSPVYSRPSHPVSSRQPLARAEPTSRAPASRDQLRREVAPPPSRPPLVRREIESSRSPALERAPVTRSETPQSGYRIQPAPSSRVQSSPSSSRVQPAPQRSAPSRVESTAPRSSTSRVQSPPARSTSPRARPSSSQSSSSRVQSSSRSTTRRSSSASSSRSSRTAPKKDD